MRIIAISDQQNFIAASGTTIAAISYQTAYATLPVPTISYSAGALVSPLKTVPHLRKIEYIPHEEAMALYYQIEPEYAKTNKMLADL
jgi:hypothetical protein